MKTIYLINSETNQVISTFTDIIDYGSNYVLYRNGLYPGKVYASPNEYFAEELPQVEPIGEPNVID